MSLLYKGDFQRGEDWRQLFARMAPEIELRIWPDIGDASTVRYLAAWEPSIELIASLPALEVLFSLGAGVDQFDLSRLAAATKLVRLVESGLTAGMVEYVVFAVLSLHRNMLDYAAAQREARWAPRPSTLADDRRIGVMGLGALGQAVIARLKTFGFPLRGWSRSAHEIEGVTCFAGPARFTEFLADCDILICLLPLTPQTCGVLNRDTFAALPPGAALINVGRGGHLVEADLLAALASGHISGAVLDVLEAEPAAPDHPFWRHPRIALTPHIASMTHTQSAGRAILDNIRAHEAGQPMTGLVGRDRGY